MVLVLEITDHSCAHEAQFSTKSTGELAKYFSLPNRTRYSILQLDLCPAGIYFCWPINSLLNLTLIYRGLWRPAAAAITTARPHLHLATCSSRHCGVDTASNMSSPPPAQPAAQQHRRKRRRRNLVKIEQVATPTAATPDRADRRRNSPTTSWCSNHTHDHTGTGKRVPAFFFRERRGFIRRVNNTRELTHSQPI